MTSQSSSQSSSQSTSKRPVLVQEENDWIIIEDSSKENSHSNHEIFIETSSKIESEIDDIIIIEDTYQTSKHFRESFIEHFSESKKSREGEEDIVIEMDYSGKVKKSTQSDHEVIDIEFDDVRFEDREEGEVAVVKVVVVILLIGFFFCMLIVIVNYGCRYCCFQNNGGKDNKEGR